MKSPTLRSYMLLALTLGLLSACSAHCNCPVCPQTQAQPQTTIIHEPE